MSLIELIKQATKSAIEIERIESLLCITNVVTVTMNDQILIDFLTQEVITVIIEGAFGLINKSSVILAETLQSIERMIQLQ